MFLKNFINECKAWRIVNKVYKKNINDFRAIGLKKDWFGKLYKVINRDTDVVLGSEEDSVYLHNDLAIIWNVLVKNNIVDILAYELKPLEGEKVLDDGNVEYEHAYLVTFTPAWNLDKQYVTWKSILIILLILAGLITCGCIYLPLLF